MLSRTWSSGSYSYLTSYLYENTAWGDLLTSYKGQKLAYEGQTYVSTTSVTGTPKSGNPISYYNGTRWTMGWQGANQLISASSSGKSLSFTYDVNGLRTSKTYNGTKYQYAYAGDRLLWQSWSGNEMFFFYDEQGAPFAFRHVSSSGTVTVGYYFLNGQGDVVQIENASGTVLATYSYDPWGKPFSSTGTFASINPLRYRGYYYDTETGFYYLQSRYYDPTISRFINADSYAATGSLLGYNMFAYCENNPVNALDSSGSYPIEVGDNPDRRPMAVPSFFGAESSVVSTTDFGQPLNWFFSDPAPITITSGSRTEIIYSQSGDSSAPISVYSTYELTNPLASTAGIKFNIQEAALGTQLGLCDSELFLQKNHNNATEQIAIKLDLARLKLGVEYSTSVKSNNTVTTSYTNVSLSGWFIASVFMFISYGEFIPSPAY